MVEARRTDSDQERRGRFRRSRRQTALGTVRHPNVYSDSTQTPNCDGMPVTDQEVGLLCNPSRDPVGRRLHTADRAPAVVRLSRDARLETDEAPLD